MKNKNLALLAIFLSALLAGGAGTMIKIGLQNIPPFSFTFLRFLTASIFIYPLFIKETKKIKIDFNIILVSLLCSLNIILFVIGIKWTLVNVSQMLYLGVPIIVSIISYFVLKEKISQKKLLGITIGLIGSILLISLKFDNKYTIWQSLIGNLIIFIASISYSFYLVFSKKLQHKYSPIYITTIFSLTTMIVSLILAFSDFYFYRGWWLNLNYISLISILYVGIFATSLAYLLSQYAIKHSSSLISSLGLYIQPLFTFVWAYLLLGEKITSNFFLSALMVFIGAWMVTRES